MRYVILAMTMALTLVTGELRAADNKPPRADVGPGRAAWFVLKFDVFHVDFVCVS